MDFILQNLYLVNLFGIVLLTLALLMIEKAVFQRLYSKVQTSPRIWDDALVYALHFPLKVYILFSGLIFTVAIAEKTFMENPWIVPYIGDFHKVGVFLLCVWAFLRFIRRFETQSSIRSVKYDRTTMQGISQVLKVLVFSFVGLGIMQFLGIPLSAAIAFGGIGGIAVGFAAKDLLANFFGGLMIFLDRPFQVGDWIRSSDKEIEGIVEHIGWRLTRIKTLDKKPLFIPNSIFSTIALENPSRMSNRRIKTKVSLRYEDASKVATIISDMEKVLKTHPEIDHTQDYFVNLIDFGPYSLEVLIYAFTKTTDGILFQAIQQDVFLKMLDVIRGHGSKIAYPAVMRGNL